MARAAKIYLSQGDVVMVTGLVFRIVMSVQFSNKAAVLRGGAGVRNRPVDMSGADETDPTDGTVLLCRTPVRDGGLRGAGFGSGLRVLYGGEEAATQLGQSVCFGSIDIPDLMKLWSAVVRMGLRGLLIILRCLQRARPASQEPGYENKRLPDPNIYPPFIRCGRRCGQELTF